MAKPFLFGGDDQIRVRISASNIIGESIMSPISFPITFFKKIGFVKQNDVFPSEGDASSKDEFRI